MGSVPLTGSRQVRLVRDLAGSQAWYRDVLGCEVDGWGHALRDAFQLVLQQAADPADVRPNAVAAARDTYPTDWQGPQEGWDSYVFVEFDDFDALVAELHERGADTGAGPVEATHSDGMTFRNVTVRDPDGYAIVFGCGARRG
ncbi:VOC family protein [Cellulomonas telluris]|uniref:VOC family protein n=1 Tax=Cellulomonas telluris TaxID=2306636 RepID=UPI0010A876DB|nr:VOC family protein [Cellulomonas telluris]